MWTRFKRWLIRKLEGKKQGLTVTNQGDGYAVALAVRLVEKSPGNVEIQIQERTTGKRLLFAGNHEATTFHIGIDQVRQTARVNTILENIPVEFVPLEAPGNG
jgi:hypothetical protein